LRFGEQFAGWGGTVADFVLLRATSEACGCGGKGTCPECTRQLVSAKFFAGREKGAGHDPTSRLLSVPTPRHRLPRPREAARRIAEAAGMQDCSRSGWSTCTAGWINSRCRPRS
jgi:hypothetical protein